MQQENNKGEQQVFSKLEFYENTEINIECNNLLYKQQNQSFSEIVEVLEAQNGFIIKDRSLFNNVILQQYFKHNNYDSFRRQLNKYGFKLHQVKEGQLIYINEECNFTKEEQSLRQNKQNNKELTFDEEQQQLFSQLIQIKNSQKQMIDQVAQIMKLQEQTQSSIKLTLINYLKKRIRSLKKRRYFRNLMYQIFSNVKNAHLNKLRINNLTYETSLILLDESFFFQNCQHYFPSLNFKPNLSVLFGHKDINEQVDGHLDEISNFEERLSISNLSNFFDL